MLQPSAYKLQPMNPAVVLYLIRLLSALILLGFVAVIAWLIYREMQVTEQALSEKGKFQGQLRVVANEQDVSLIPL